MIIGALRTIHSAQQTFAVSCGHGFYAPDLPALGSSPAVPSGFLPPDLAHAREVEHAGYRIFMTGTPAPDAPSTCNRIPAGEALNAYAVTAAPLAPGNLWFGTNTTGRIFRSPVQFDMPESVDPGFAASAIQ